jgi:hypothetical protein
LPVETARGRNGEPAQNRFYWFHWFDWFHWLKQMQDGFGTETAKGQKPEFNWSDSFDWFNWFVGLRVVGFSIGHSAWSKDKASNLTTDDGLLTTDAAKRLF